MEPEVYTFSHNIGEVSETLTFCVPSCATRVGTFAEMCARAAKAFGFAEKNVDEYIQSDDDAFMEYGEEEEGCHSSIEGRPGGDD